MLRAEERDRPGTKPKPDESSGSEAAPAKKNPSAGRLTARCGFDAVNAAVRAVYGNGAVHEPPLAEGLALGGKRAATLLDETVGDDVPSAELAYAGPWVHHRVAATCAGLGDAFTFDLVAASAQEAVDHCLAAHRMAGRLGAPGSCTLDRGIAAAPHLVRLPDRGLLSDLMREERTGGPMGRPTPAETLEAAREALGRVSALTGRSREPVGRYRMEGAECVLVAAGGSVARAREIVDALREAGVATGLVTVALLRPFPSEEVARALEGSRSVAVFEPASDRVGGSRLLTEIRAALGNAGGPDLHAVSSSAGDESGLASALAGALGLRPDQEAALASKPGATERRDPPAVIGAAPAGFWSRELLLDAAALAGTLGPLRLDCPQEVDSGLVALTVGRSIDAQESSPGLDLLFVADPRLLEPGGRLLRAVRDGGTLLLHARSRSPQEVLLALGEDRCRKIAARGIRLQWLAAPDPNEGTVSPDELRQRLLGAILGAGDSLGRAVGADGRLLEAVCESAEVANTAGAADLLWKGAAALHELDCEAADPVTLRQETDFRPPRTMPLMPGAPEGAAEAGWRGALHRFHLSGEGAHSPAEPLPSLPLRPAGLAPLAEPRRVWRHYPIVVFPDGTTRTIDSLATEALEAIESEGGEMPLLREEVYRFSRTVSHVRHARGGGSGLREVLDEACERFAGEFDLSKAGTEALAREIDLLKQRLPEGGEVVALDPSALLRFYSAALGAERGSRRFAFLEEVRTLIVRLEELIQIDDSHAPESTSVEKLSAILGTGVGIRVDTGALSRMIPRHRGSLRMPPQRRARVESALATLRSYVESSADEPECVLIQASAVGGESPPPAASVIEHPCGLEAAIGLFDGLADRMTEVIRAARTARLERDAAYSEKLHDPILNRLDWQAFTEEELLLIPPVAVLETGERLRGPMLAAFSSLLRSGRPVQVLVLESTSGVPAGETWEALSGYHPGLGYLAVAHREAFVLQATLAHPERLVQSLRKLVTVHSPSAALVAVPCWSSPVAEWLQLAASHFGRGVPLFRYDPEAGATWANRFDLSENPDPEKAWPVSEFVYEDESGAEQRLDEPFTFAHAAALEPVYRPHFRMIPAQAWSDDQVTVGEYLAAPDAERIRRIPYLWVVDEEGVLQRAVMTREMVFACLDHRRAWRILQELGGADNEYAHRAAEAAREQALAEADEARAAMEAAHAEALEQARAAAASDAMERLVAVLMSEDALAALSGAAPVATAPAAAPTEAPAAAPAVEAPPAEEEEEAVSFNEPYIDSILCTTCNECTNLNPRMFQYNANKQATIADPAAGTFEQLVKAAEKCPARCIHPGAPRSDDDTVTDDLIARAAKFN